MKQNKAKKKSSSGWDKIIVQLTRRRAAGWIATSCFVLVWTFVLGVIVGRGMAPVQFDIDALQKELNELKAAMVEKERHFIGQRAKNLESAADFDFHEDLKKTRSTPRLELAQNTAPARRDYGKPMALEPGKSVPVKTRSPDIKKKKISSPKAAPSSGTKPEKKHTIQVAAVKDPKIADELVANLKKKGFPAYRVVGKTSAADIWYRVRVGHFSTRGEAGPMLGRLKKEYKEALLVYR